jgi:predicted negative regulator of RcsB-dependent stress response
MQTQDAPTEYLFKLWPWIEANKNRLIAGAGIIVALIFVCEYLSWQREQHEIAAGEALTQLTLSAPPSASGSQLAAGFLRIASEYPGTLAGQRAQLSGATTLFEANQFADAQTQFQKYLDARPDGAFSASAALGVAASLEAQGKLDQAAITYQRVANNPSDIAASINAKFGQARVDELQGKFNEAMNTYADIARLMPNSEPASEAELRAVELKAKMAAAKPATAKP